MQRKWKNVNRQWRHLLFFSLCLYVYSIQKGKHERNLWTMKSDAEKWMKWCWNENIFFSLLSWILFSLSGKLYFHAELLVTYTHTENYVFWQWFCLFILSLKMINIFTNTCFIRLGVGYYWLSFYTHQHIKLSFHKHAHC